MFNRCCCYEDLLQQADTFVEPFGGAQRQESAAVGADGGAFPDPSAVNLVEAKPSSKVGASEPRLQVPADFTLRSVRESKEEGNMEQLQSVIKDFITQFLHGVWLDVLVRDGQLMPVRCFLDNELSKFSMEIDDTVRAIPMSEIREVKTGGDQYELRTTTPVDDHCCTLVLAKDHTVSFRFPSLSSLEHFSLCMQLLLYALVE
mmetsp:Transcript_11606/g.25801  ORF Transcript_11606/g.25801 Transcript_11606/m.25801 type:complete len:203 (-) Transcript_11606:106-714(-)